MFRQSLIAAAVAVASSRLPAVSSAQSKSSSCTTWCLRRL